MERDVITVSIAVTSLPLLCVGTPTPLVVAVVVIAPNAAGDNAQGVDVEAGIGFIEDGDVRFEYRHLQNLVALFFAA